MATAVSPSAAGTAAGSHPNTRHPTQTKLAPSRTRVRDFYAGTDRIHEKFKEYLPKHELEGLEAWKARAQMAEVFDALKRSVDTGAGLLHSRPIAIGDDVPALIKTHLEAVDGAQEHIDVFSRRIAVDGLQAGFGGILVDSPPAPEKKNGAPLSIEEEDRLGIRPYWAWYRSEDVVSWRHTREGARTVLTQLVLHESAEVEAGEFGVTSEDRYRIFRRALGTADANGMKPHLVTWREVAERLVEGKSTLVEIGSGVIHGQDEIPFSPLIAGTEDGRWYVTPPKKALCDLVLAHWRVTTDRRWNLSLSLVPVAVRTGYVDMKRPIDDDDDVRRPRGREDRSGIGQAVIAVGGTAMMDLPAGGDFKWVVAPSEATTHAMAELDAIERRMGAIEFSFMFADRRDDETATAKRINSATQGATLASFGRALQDCLEGALIYHARYLRGRIGEWKPKPRDGGEGGSLSLNTDFETTVMAPELLRVLNDMATVGNLPLRVLYALMQRGGILPEGEKPEDLVGEVMKEALDAMKRDAGADPVVKDGADGKAPPNGDPGGDDPDPDPSGDGGGQ